MANTKALNPVQAIKQQRSLSNQAFKSHNMAQITGLMVDDIVVTVGTGDTIRGVNDVYAVLWSQFQASPDCLYVRTPKTIKVSLDGQLAFEEGSWVGTWTLDGEKTESKGRYAASWRLIGSAWKIQSELFVTLMEATST